MKKRSVVVAFVAGILMLGAITAHARLAANGVSLNGESLNGENLNGTAMTGAASHGAVNGIVLRLALYRTR